MPIILNKDPLTPAELMTELPWDSPNTEVHITIRDLKALLDYHALNESADAAAEHLGAL